MEDKDLTTIAAYLDGRLDPAAAAVVEQRAAREPAFAAALADYRRLNAHLAATEREDDLRQLLGELGDRHFQAGKAPAGGDTPQAKVRPLKPRRPRWLGLVVAAAVALLLLVGGRAFWGGEEGLYERFADHQPLSLTERGGQQDLGLTDIERAYNRGDFAEAIRRLRPYTAANPEDQRAQLALGVALLEEGDNAGAVNVLSALAGGGGSLAPYANWYLALAAVQRDDRPEARRLLDLIPTDDAFLRQRVADLREAL